MKDLLIINNIPTPYRIYLFNQMHHVLRAQGIGLTVWFMAEREAGRYWKIDRSQWHFDGEIVPGFHFQYRGINFHFNPLMNFKVLLNPPVWMIVGGGWHLPTSVALHFVHHPKTYRLVWAEANAKTSKLSQGVGARYRRWSLKDADGVIIPGEIAHRTLADHWHIQPKQLLYLPNLVDETLFRDRVSTLRLKRDELRAHYSIKPKQRVLFWSARLNNRSKGITNFLEAVQEFPVTILLAGEGPDRPIIEAWLKKHPSFDLRLLGHLTQEKVLECLALADTAILPSFSDPNPLAMIEAIWAGLPILTSVYCGNWPETVEPGINGWLVDPSDHAALRRAAEEIMSSDDSSLRAAGQKSLEIAQRNFDSNKQIDTFVQSLIHAFPLKRD